MTTNNDSSESKASKELKLAGMPSDIIPKYCTNISVSLLNHDQNALLGMSFSQNGSDGFLISSILIDIEHLKNLHNVISNVLNDVKKNEEGKSS